MTLPTSLSRRSTKTLSLATSSFNTLTSCMNPRGWGGETRRTRGRGFTTPRPFSADSDEGSGGRWTDEAGESFPGPEENPRKMGRGPAASAVGGWNGDSPALAVEPSLLQELPQVMTREVGFAGGARQVSSAASHDRIEVSLFETFDRALLGFRKRPHEVERASLGFASTKAEALTRDVFHPDAAVVAQCGGPNEDVAELE